MIRKPKPAHWLQAVAMRVTRVHFLYIVAYMGMIVIFDSWGLLPHDDIASRWTAAGILMVVNTVLWYLARTKFSSQSIYRAIVLLLITADVIFASYNVFWERGIASKSVALFAVPLLTAATLRSRNALFATASLCTAAYSVAAVRYFNLHYGEAFRVELYGTLAFYSAMFFVQAWLLWAVLSNVPERSQG